jgi:hypothetical protein
MQKNRGIEKMSFNSGGFLDDIMDDFLYPESKWDAIKHGFIFLIFYPVLILVVLPLSFISSFLFGFFTASPYRKCDCCLKEKPNIVTSINKFYWFCEKCNEKYNKNLDSFMEKNRRKR